jgi:hypothetical protein
MSALTSFQERAPTVMAALMKYLPPLDVEGAAAILGNLYAESRMQVVNEARPTVAGSRGGFGWVQWTGSRRLAAERFWAERKLDPKTDAAQLAFLIHELQTTEKRGLTAVMRPGTLEERTRAFELAFERAGVKNYAARYNGARVALDAYQRAPQGGPSPAPAEHRQWAEDKLAVFEVRAIQARLKALGFGHMLGSSGANKDGVDGSWGALTAGAVFAVQTRANITADGHYGPQTQAALARGLEEPRAPSPPAIDAGSILEQGLTHMFGSLIHLVGGKTLISLAVSFAAPYAARYGVGEAGLNQIVSDLALAFAAFGSADATRKAVARAAE